MPSLKRVLIIDDHRDTLSAMQYLLKSSGFHVFAYNDCKGAEVHLTANDIDIALLDVRMPGRCGDDFGKELRAKSPRTMIVFLTGEAHLEPLKDAVPDCFTLRKPIDVDVLLKLLDCFKSDDGHYAKLDDETGDQAGPAVT